ncbi:MAG: 1-deoxy-D-xylulose-5-phosphate reductoisomerase, partial [Lachnospiraceae bacterium]|nr:1-deoxy-D-xylulose-5-phosphate reductoisomerase [Lachnospiraceae bacterium]
HPQSLIHSRVEYAAGGIKAQLGTQDMRLPNAYALFYPDRRPLEGKRLDFYALSQITFEKPDTETFRGLALAYKAAEVGGSMPTVLNAANERAVNLFLNGKISFLQIADLIEACMTAHTVIASPDVEEILAAEQETYENIEKQLMLLKRGHGGMD